jgi:hypothetical protein
LVDSVKSIAGGLQFAIDVYKVNFRKTILAGVVAIPIMTHQGEAEEIFQQNALEDNIKWPTIIHPNNKVQHITK